jgi:hypothetical protein
MTRADAMRTIDRMRDYVAQNFERDIATNFGEFAKKATVQQ